MNDRTRQTLSVFALATLLGAGCASSATDPPAAASRPQAPAVDSARASSTFGKLPLRFEANKGQTADGVDFLTRGPGYTAFLTGDEAVLTLSGGDGAAVRMRLQGAGGGAEGRGLGPQIGTSNYLSGERTSWITGVPSYGSVRYDDAWPGIDMVYRGVGSGLEYDLVVAAGADAGRIALTFDHDVKLDGGDLVIATLAGPVRHQKPVAFQEIGGRRVPVPAAFDVANGREVRFALGRYDHRVPLVIDPAVLYSTLLGGPVGDGVSAIALDGAGTVFVAGNTTSPDFPVTTGSFQTVKGANTSNDAFVTKFSPAGNSLVYSTFIGGSGADSATGIAVDGAGNAYVGGLTASTNFPTTPGAFDTTKGAGATDDGFMAKLNPAGNALVYSTYVGGGLADTGAALRIDAASNAYLAGTTASTDFPTTAGAFQTAKGAGADTDAFVTKLNAAGTALVYSTYLGGSAADSGAGLAVSPGGNASLTGTTNSTNFPVFAALQGTKGADTDAFVTEIAAAGTALTYSTYLGGGGADSGSGIALDGTGNTYLTGSTASTNFPLVNPLQNTKRGPESDAFVSKLASGGASLVYSTYLGALEGDAGRAIAVDNSGSAHVGGLTSSELFPAERPVARFGGNQDAFVARLAPSGASLIYSSPYGGLGSDVVQGIAVDTDANTYIAGLSSFARDPEYFPTINAFQTVFGGGFVSGTPNSGDGFVAKIAPDAGTRPLVTRLTPRGGDVAGGAQVSLDGFGFSNASAVRFGTTAATSFTVESDRRIVAVAPALAEGIVKVTVTTAGGTSPGNPVTDFWVGEGSWALTGSLNTPRSAHTTTLLDDGRVVVAGGRLSAGGNIPLASAELYDPITGTWSATGSLAGARWSHTATLLPDGRVLVAGGYSTNTTLLASAELFNPATGTWSPAGSLARPRGVHIHALLSGPNCGSNCNKVLVAGGRGPASTDISNTTELYNPATNTWELSGNLREGRNTTEGARLRDGRVLIAGGFIAGGQTDTAEIFDPAAGVWSFTASPMSFAKTRPTVTALPDGNALVNNGWANGPVPASDIFDAATNTFRKASTPKTHRWNATALLMPNGKVLALAGGVGSNTADVYDPKLNTFRSGGSLMVGRGASSVSVAGPGGTAVVLSSNPFEFEADPRECGQSCGKVLVVGNTDDPVTELYTPSGPSGPGYWTTASDGGVFAFGDAQFFGSTGNLRLNSPVVGMAATPSGKGYWLVASDGGIFAFGDATFFGSTGNIRLNSPVVGMTATASGKGYWLVAADGGLFAFGDAAFFGSTGNLRLNRPMVGMAATRAGKGYWLVASDGGIFAFGDAPFRGSTGNIRLNQPVVGMASVSTGTGYWLVASDGGIFAFGDAPFRGSTGNIRLNQPVVGMAAVPLPLVAGYWMVASDGGIFAFGDARFSGSTGNIRLNRPMVAMAANPIKG